MEETVVRIQGRASTSFRDPKEPIIVFGIYPFEADPNATDELSFAVGERLVLLESFDDGWGLARNAQDEEGVFPLSYTTLSDQLPSSAAARLCDTGVYVPRSLSAHLHATTPTPTTTTTTTTTTMSTLNGPPRPGGLQKKEGKVVITRPHRSSSVFQVDPNAMLPPPPPLSGNIPSSIIASLGHGSVDGPVDYTQVAGAPSPESAGYEPPPVSCISESDLADILDIIEENLYDTVDEDGKDGEIFFAPRLSPSVPHPVPTSTAAEAEAEAGAGVEAVVEAEAVAEVEAEVEVEPEPASAVMEVLPVGGGGGKVSEPNVRMSMFFASTDPFDFAAWDPAVAPGTPSATSSSPDSAFGFPDVLPVAGGDEYGSATGANGTSGKSGASGATGTMEAMEAGAGAGAEAAGGKVPPKKPSRRKPRVSPPVISREDRTTFNELDTLAVLEEALTSTGADDPDPGDGDGEVEGRPREASMSALAALDALMLQFDDIDGLDALL